MMANRRSGNADVQRNGHGNECFVCKKSCNYTCSRCGEFYCSKQCQSVNWSEHKYYCFEMPELIMISQPQNGQQIGRNSIPHSNNKLNKSPQNEYRKNDRRGGERDQPHSRKETARSANNSPPPTQSKSVFTFADPPKNNDDVVLTFVRFANSFYIRSCSNDSEFTQNAKDFDQWGQSAAKLVSLPQKNDVILVKNEGKFQRAVVLQAHSHNEVEIALADTGRKIHKTVDDMRQLSDELKNRRRHNFIVTLDHLPKNLPNELFVKLFDFVRSKTVFKLQFDGDDWITATNFKLLEKRNGLPIEVAVGAETNNDSAKNGGAAKNKGAAMNNIPSTTLPASITQNVEEPISSPIVMEKKTNETNESNRPKETELLTPKQLTLQDLSTESLPDVADLIITDNTAIESGYVSAILHKNISKLTDLHNKVEEYGNADDNIYIPRPEELCLVRWGEGDVKEWYRAINYQSKYLLIDWGPLQDIDDHEIRRFPAQLNDPCYTFSCFIEGFTKDRLEDFRISLEVDLETIHSKCVCVKSIEDPYEYRVTFATVKDFIKK